jgi:hypothetical protein
MSVPSKILAEVLQKCDGVPSAAAKVLGVTPQAVRKRLRENPALQAIASEARESLVDLAESKLRKFVENEDFRAVKFVLETWGRDRGFARSLKLEPKIEPKARILLMLPTNNRQPLLECEKHG